MSDTPTSDQTQQEKVRELPVKAHKVRELLEKHYFQPLAEGKEPTMKGQQIAEAADVDKTYVSALKRRMTLDKARGRPPAPPTGEGIRVHPEPIKIVPTPPQPTPPAPPPTPPTAAPVISKEELTQSLEKWITALNSPIERRCKDTEWKNIPLTKPEVEALSSSSAALLVTLYQIDPLFLVKLQFGLVTGGIMVARVPEIIKGIGEIRGKKEKPPEKPKEVKEKAEEEGREIAGAPPPPAERPQWLEDILSGKGA